MFMLQKPLFMLFHYNLFEKASLIDWMQVIYHGLPLDLSVASYILALPVFVALVTVWIQGLWAEWFYKSKEWAQTRDAYMVAQHYLCERCGEPAKIVHHKIWLTPKNIHEQSMLKMEISITSEKNTQK